MKQRGHLVTVYNGVFYSFGNRDIDLDDGLEKLKNREVVTSLVLTGNKLVHVGGVKLLEWLNLQLLKLDSNQLVQLDTEILLLPNLKELDVSRNFLTKLPSITAKKLEKLNVASNNIFILPESIFTCERLKEFNIAKLQIMKWLNFLMQLLV